MPKDTAPPSAAQPSATPSFGDALIAQLNLAGNTAPADTATPPADPVKEIADTATPPADPVKEIADTAPPPDEPPLPIDELNEPDPADAPPPEPKDKVAYAMKELREENKTLKTTVADAVREKAQYEARIAELEAKAKQVDELTPKLAEYENEMLAVRVEKSKEYREQVAQPVQGIREKLEKIVARNEGLDIDRVIEVFDTDDDDAATAALADLVSGLDVTALDLMAITKLRSDYQPIKAKQAEIYSKADKMLLELDARGKQKTEEEILAAAEARERALPMITRRMLTGMPAFTDTIEAVAKQVAGVDPSTLPVDAAIYNHIAGLSLPKVVKAFNSLKKENAELVDELAKYRQLNSIPGAFTPSAPGDTPKDLGSAISRGLGMG